MYFLFIVLSLLCSVNAIQLTYPIKGAYVGWRAVNWSAPASVLSIAADSGFNLLVLTFYSNQANDFVSDWDGFTINKTAALEYPRSKGVAILLGIWIETDYGNVISVQNSTQLGIGLANQALLRNFDGVDIQIREMGSSFSIGGQSATQSVQWVVNLTIALRNTLGNNKIITFSPLATDWGPIGGSGPVGPTGGYTSIHPHISNLIQHYHVQYYGLGSYCYTDYTGIFTQSGSASCQAETSVQEISTNANVNISRLVVMKPFSTVEDGAPSVAYMTPAQLKSAYNSAVQNLGWNAGTIGYTWNFNDSDCWNWITSIYPLNATAPTAPPSSVVTISSLIGSSSSASSSSLSSTSQFSTSSTSLSPSSSSSTSGGGFVQDCGANKIKQPDGSCTCVSGYYESGGSCKQKSILIIAIIIPIIVVVVIIVVIAFFLLRRRREVKLGRMARLPSKTMSIPDLEVNYQSTNLITDYESIVIKSRLGQGGSGVVNMGIWRHIEVAVKEFSNQDIQTTDFIRESEIHAKLRHPNVVQLLAICLPPHMCTISEYMAKGSLADVLQQKPTSFTWKRKMQALHDIAKGMDYLQQSKIIHRDLKSQNCLIDKNWNCKIADFGTSKLVGEVNQTATAYVPRTAQWSAPEVIVRGDYSEKSDVYSFGVIMWECLTGEVPYDGMFAFQVEDRTVRGSRLTIPAGCDAWYEGLMRECWQENPSERPSFETIISVLEKSGPPSSQK